ncbi:MAG: 2-oxoacid:acceptor oxidoreductase family protein [Chloroflexi bacterium]|nr:2-oxoacid:acceptor oxidoreductase family protein [Chloroflexota bacterium]
MAQSKELNLVSMSGQGSVQAGEALAKVYAQQGWFVSVNVYPGTRARSAPVLNYIKISDSPALASCANYHPSEAIVFQEELLLTARENTHELIADAIGRMKQGVLLVNSPKAPGEIELPFDFQGVVATVDATGIAERLLKRTPPPVGLTLLGAYTRITESMDLELLLEVIKETFPGSVGLRNAQATLEAYQKVQVIGGVQFRVARQPARLKLAKVEELPQYYRFDRYDLLAGFSKGSPFIWRDKVPICEDSKCTCPGSCVSEVMCPDGTGFIVRQGLPQQGYRIDVDYCRGCGICVEVCVGHALRMVDEDEVRRERPRYEGITVEPYLKEPAGQQRRGADARQRSPVAQEKR